MSLAEKKQSRPWCRLKNKVKWRSGLILFSLLQELTKKCNCPHQDKRWQSLDKSSVSQQGRWRLPGGFGNDSGVCMVKEMARGGIGWELVWKKRPIAGNINCTQPASTFNGQIWEASPLLLSIYITFNCLKKRVIKCSSVWFYLIHNGYMKCMWRKKKANNDKVYNEIFHLADMVNDIGQLPASNCSKQIVYCLKIYREFIKRQGRLEQNLAK